MSLSRQQIFDAALFICRKQKRPCQNERGWNIFHHRKLRSFTGLWVPVDIAEDMAVNVMTAEEFVHAFPEIFDQADATFVADLEYIHDAFEPQEWEHQLQLFANKHQLVYEPKDIKWQHQRTSQVRLRAS